MIAVSFLVFAGLSACLGALFGALGVLRLVNPSTRFLGIYIIGSAILGAGAAIAIGFAMRWNVVGGAIMATPTLGCSAWGAIGFGWSALASFVVGSVVRRLFPQKRSGQHQVVTRH